MAEGEKEGSVLEFRSEPTVDMLVACQ